MSLIKFKACANLFQVVPIGLLAPCSNPTIINLQLVRHRTSKHWNPKYKWHRKMKFIKVDLPDFENEKSAADMTPEEMRSKLKEKGLLPPRPWIERPFYISCTGGIFEPYVPPEGDGKISPISMHGAKQRMEFIEKKSKSMMAIRKIRSFDEDFEVRDFVDQAQETYVNTHMYMTNKDKDRLQQCITERAFPEIMHNCVDKTINWKFVKSLEPPRVVHARCTDVVSKDNIFGQVTVRFHTQQILAVYDRFGRLMHGSEIIAKDVLEYVVFEKHLSNQYGLWRIHEKIVPDWMPPKDPLPKTYVVSKEAEEEVSKAVETVPPETEMVTHQPQVTA